MTSTSGRPLPDRDEGRPPETSESQSEGAPGVELGMSEKSGGTFEPEESPDEKIERAD